MFSNQFLSFCLFLSIFGVLIIRSSTDERVLYQSDFSNAKDWTPERSPGRSKEGWSLYQEEGVYRTCDVDSSSLSSATNLRNVLTKNFTKSAEFTKIHIEATLSIKPCAEISNGGSVKPGCKEVVSVEIGYNSPSETRPQKEILSLESDLNVKAVEFPPDVTKFSISLVDEGVCADLSKFKISVFVCKAKIVNLIEFSETVSKDDIVRTTEKCVDNAVSEKPVKGFCFQGGVWKQPDKNLCLCKPGFEPDSSLISCKSCEPGSYKSETSNGVCQRCPLNSNAYYSAFTECVCSDNFARKDPKDVSLPCLPQPNKPRSLKTTLTTHSQIELSWDQPIMTSYQIDPNPGPIWYTVHCSQPQPQCNGLQYIETNETRITIDKLQADTSFTWRVCAENAVSKFIQAMSNCETLKVATLKMVKVTSLKADVSDNMQLMLYWSEPDSVADSSRVRGGNSYRIKFISPGNSVVVTIVNGTTNCVDRFCSYTIPPTLQPGTYQFQVGFGSPAIFSDPIQVPIDSNLPMSEEIRRLMITVGLLFAVLLMILASCIAIFCCCRQKIDQTHPRLKTTLTGNFYEQYTTIAPPTIQDYSFKVAGFEGGFEEPTLHPDPEALLAKYTRELNENQVLCSYQKLKGKYNEAVELGTYCEESGGSESKMSVGLQHFVPLETMPNCAGSVDSMSMNGYTDLEQFNQQTRRELMIAAATCAQLIHPNVLSLKGFVKRDDESFTVVTEHAELGSLLILLQQGHVTNVSTIIHMARGVACGMRYLQEEGYIHKVLKTSNVLVSQNLVCKISGFSQRAKIENQEKNASLMIPEDLVPWTAPEVLLYQQFSWASDVWSFGVLLWEMLSQGSMPYYDQEIPATQILRVLEAGYRLPMPPNSPSLAYDLMTRCWCGEGNGRPQFASIVEVLETLMKKPLDFGPDFDTSQWLGPANYAMYNAAAATKQPGGMYTPGGTSFRAHQQLSPPATSSPPGSHPYQNTLPTPVSTLLAQINMHQYESLFLMTGIQTIEDLSRLSVHDLKAIGVSSSKHRKRIVQSCSRLTAAASKQNVELDYSVAYGTTSSVNGKSWNTSQLSPGPREQLMSQYV